MFLLLVIAILTVSIYYGSLNNQFLNDWDDGIYVTNNSQIKTESTVKTAFTNFSNGHYHPLTTLSYSIEYKLFGLNPKPFHTTNLVLHILNAFLVFAFIKLLIQKNFIAFVTALLFAIHPMHVESVAWISDRKDLLCSLFYIGAMCTYLIYIKDKKTKSYLFTFLLFLLALFSKAMAITLPIVFFILDYFMGRKFSVKTVIEKIPFLILTLIFGYVSVLAQRSIDALGDMNTVSFLAKIMFSSYSVIMYVLKLFSFSDLSAFYNYPLTENGKYPLIFYLSPFIVLALLIFIFKLKQQKETIWFGFGFFLITIALVLQIVPAGNVIMADRYTYLPYIGLFFIIAVLINAGISNFRSRSAKPILTVVLVLYVGCCTYYSYNRTKVWNDSMTLWSDTIGKNPDAALPYSNRAALFIKEKNTEKAISDLNKAIEIRPKYVTAHYNRGMAFLNVGKFNEAIDDFSFVLQNKNRDMVSVYMNRASAYMYVGNYQKAIEDFTSALRYDPNIAEAYYSRAISLYKIKDYERAKVDALTAQQMRYPVEKDFLQAIFSKTK